MPAPGDKLRSVWTADFANRLMALLTANGQQVTVAGRGYASNSRRGSQIVIPAQQSPVSTIQGQLAGGTPISVSDGTEIIDPYAWGAYSIQGAYFKTSAGTTVATVFVNGTPVSWLTAIAVGGGGVLTPIPNPVLDLTHVLAVGDILSIQLASSSGDCAGFQFSLNCPF